MKRARSRKKSSIYPVNSGATLGEKLKYYRDRKLYRFEASTFGQWCEQEIGLKRNYAYKLIAAFDVYDHIQREMCTTVMCITTSTTYIEQNLYAVYDLHNVVHLIFLFCKYSNVHPFSRIVSKGVHSPVASNTRMPSLVP